MASACCEVRCAEVVGQVVPVREAPGRCRDAGSRSRRDRSWIERPRDRSASARAGGSWAGPAKTRRVSGRRAAGRAAAMPSARRRGAGRPRDRCRRSGRRSRPVPGRCGIRAAAIRPPLMPSTRTSARRDPGGHEVDPVLERLERAEPVAVGGPELVVVGVGGRVGRDQAWQVADGPDPSTRRAWPMSPTIPLTPWVVPPDRIVALEVGERRTEEVGVAAHLLLEPRVGPAGHDHGPAVRGRSRRSTRAPNPGDRGLRRRSGPPGRAGAAGAPSRNRAGLRAPSPARSSDVSDVSTMKAAVLVVIAPA